MMTAGRRRSRKGSGQSLSETTAIESTTLRGSCGTSAEDVVRALPDDDGVLWFSETLVQGGHQTIRIIPRDDGRLNGDRQAVLDAFAHLNVSGEGLSDQLRIVALDIGTDADVAAVRQLCIDGEVDGRWYHEEGNVTPEWIAS